MEESKNCAYDYEHCERVWRKVAPQENPYPEARAAMEAGEKTDGLLPTQTQEEPCCMGTAAVQSLEVLRGFVREELAARQTYLDFARCLSSREVRRVLHAMAADEERHARQLSAAIYLATGETYCPRVCVERTHYDSYCAALRQFYHEEACGGYNYFRAGEETLDYCLEQMFSAMSQDEYRHARTLLNLLSKALKA